MARESYLIRVPGSTSNLGPGFDTLGLALKLYLRVVVSVAGHRTELEMHREGADELPRDASNLIYLAYVAACEVLRTEPQPLKLWVHNEIPLQRGLGSSGAAVAAGFAIAQAFAGKRLLLAQALRLGYQFEGHLENFTASWLGGLTINCANEEVLLAQSIAPPSWGAVILIPELRIATETARQRLPESVPFQDAVANVQRVAMLVAGLMTGDFRRLQETSRDRLHQPYREALVPGFRDVVKAALDAGAYTAFLSGSGSSIVALAGPAAETVQETMQKVAATLPYASRCRAIALDPVGTQAEQDEPARQPHRPDRRKL